MSPDFDSYGLPVILDKIDVWNIDPIHMESNRHDISYIAVETAHKIIDLKWFWLLLSETVVRFFLLSVEWMTIHVSSSTNIDDIRQTPLQLTKFDNFVIRITVL